MLAPAELKPSPETVRTEPLGTSLLVGGGREKATLVDRVGFSTHTSHGPSSAGWVPDGVRAAVLHRRDQDIVYVPSRGVSTARARVRSSIQHVREPASARVLVLAECHQVHRLHEPQSFAEAPGKQPGAEGNEERERVVRGRRPA